MTSSIDFAGCIIVIFLLLSLWSFSVFAQELKTVVQRGHLGDVTKIISYKKIIISDNQFNNEF